MEKVKSEDMDMFLRIMLIASGADTIAPQELQDNKLKALGLTDDEGLEYQAVAKILNNMALGKRVKVLKAVVANTLPPTQIMEVGTSTREDVKSILDYLEEHPEAREKVDAEEAAKRLFGVDFDID